MAKKSLTQQAAEKQVAPVESNPGTGLPVGFGGDQGTAIEVHGSVYKSSPYVLFVSPRGQGFAKLAQFIPDLQDGDPVLVLPEPEKPLLLTPFRFYLVSAWQHFSVVDSQGQILQSTTDVEKAKLPPPGGGKWDEHVEAVILVCHLDGDLTPARITFKTTKTNAVHRAIEARGLAASADWGKQSPEHKASLVVPAVWARYTTTVTMKHGTGKTSGFKYVAANGRVAPSSVADWKSLTEAFQDAGFKEECEQVMAAHNRRVAGIKQAIKE